MGLAVRDPKHAKAFLLGLGYRVGETVFDPEQHVNLIMCEHDSMPDVEIVYPGSGPSPVDALLKRHQAGIVYHPCYTTPNLEQAARGLEEAGLRPRCVMQPKPAVLFGGKTVAFYDVVGIGLIEMLEEKDVAPGAGTRGVRTASARSGT